MHGKTYMVNNMDDLLKMFGEFDTMMSEKKPDAKTKAEPKVDTVAELRKEIEVLKSELARSNAVHDENIDKITEMFDVYNESIEALLQFAKVFIEIPLAGYGEEGCDCCAEQAAECVKEDAPEVGKWYLTWDDTESISDAEVRSFVGVDEDGAFTFIDSPADDKDYAVTFDNYKEIDAALFGKLLPNGNLESGKLYYVFDDDASKGCVEYATSKKRTFVPCKSLLNVKDLWSSWNTVRVVDKRTVGRGSNA